LAAYQFPAAVPSVSRIEDNSHNVMVAEQPSQVMLASLAPEDQVSASLMKPLVLQVEGGMPSG